MQLREARLSEVCSSCLVPNSGVDDSPPLTVNYILVTVQQELLLELISVILLDYRKKMHYSRLVFLMIWMFLLKLILPMV